MSKAIFVPCINQQIFITNGYYIIIYYSSAQIYYFHFYSPTNPFGCHTCGIYFYMVCYYLLEVKGYTNKCLTFEKVWQED